MGQLLDTVLQVLATLAVPSLIVAGLIWSVRTDPRRLRNGFLLIMAADSLVGLLAQALGSLGPGRLFLDGFSLGLLVVLVPVALLLPLALIANGVTMVRRESRSLANLLSLVVGIALAIGPFLLTIPLVNYVWWTIAPVFLLGTVALTLGFWFLGFFAYSLLYTWLVRRARGNAVIVLGAQVVGDRVPPLLAGRLSAAIDAADRGSQAVPLVVSGGRGADEAVAEGDAMAQWLRERGVTPDRVLVEDRATTTAENLRYSAALLSDRAIAPPYLIATSNYHAPRAALLARSIGLDAQAVGGRTAWYYVPSAYLREFVAVLSMRRTWVLVSVLPALVLSALVAVAAMNL